uniref:Uncharacterized protein n=1 Tax=Nelumbo nucifera TaxID=4432 RepID=A0A822ZAP4_NELNU|nr:TPA_asm: hypothetical protein HUJ06_012910 [Nelumbo nucifera]
MCHVLGGALLTNRLPSIQPNFLHTREFEREIIAVKRPKPYILVFSFSNYTSITKERGIENLARQNWQMIAWMPN